MRPSARSPAVRGLPGACALALLASACAGGSSSSTARDWDPEPTGGSGDDADLADLGDLGELTELVDRPTDIVGMAGEFEPVERVLLGWHPGNWNHLEFFANVLLAVLPDVSAVVAVENEEEGDLLFDALRERGVDVSRIDLVVHPLESMWIRDYGPMLVRTAAGGLRVIDLPYQEERKSDDRYPIEFAARERLPVTTATIDLEGGHIQADGLGRCVATQSVLTRNEALGIDSRDVHTALRDYFGCHEVTFVPELLGEETGHVDIFAYVTGPGRILMGSYDRADDAHNARRLDTGARRLRRAGWVVTRVPMPRSSRRRVFRSYTNAIVTDRTVIVPVYRADRRHQRVALQAFRRAFPGRRVVGVEADDVISLAGAVHCTMITVPRVRAPEPMRARTRAATRRPPG